MPLLSTKVAFLELLPTHVLNFAIFHIFGIIISSLQAQKLEENVCILTKHIRSSKKLGVICAIECAKKQTNILILQFKWL